MKIFYYASKYSEAPVLFSLGDYGPRIQIMMIAGIMGTRQKEREREGGGHQKEPQDVLERTG